MSTSVRSIQNAHGKAAMWPKPWQAVVAWLGLLLLGGCTALSSSLPPAPFSPVPPPASPPAPDSGGTRLRGVNPDFEITTYPARVFTDKEGLLRIEYKCAAVNAARTDFENFTMTIELNPEMDTFLSSGLNMVPFGPITLLGLDSAFSNPETQGRGVVYGTANLLQEKQFLAQYSPGRSLREVLDIGGVFVIVLTWQGGHERIEVRVPVVDSDGLLK